MKLLFQGDSITDGNRYKDPASRWDKNHQIGHAWPYVVTGSLMCRFPGRFDCVNRGVSGSNVFSLRDRWKEDTLDEHPDVLLLLTGVNDAHAAEDGRCRASDFGPVYRELLGAVRRENPAVRFVLLEPFYLGDRETVREILDGMRAEVRAIAGETGAIFVPLMEDFRAFAEKDGTAYWLWDGVHPTEAGHYHIARKVLEYAGDLLGVGDAGRLP